MVTQAIWCREIESREQFGKLLESRGLLGRAVEVGTHRGEFAATLLRGWPGQMLTCIDPWRENLPGYHDPLAGRPNRLGDLLATLEAIEPFGDRTDLMRASSPDAARKFGDGSLDFVYLDGNHAEAAVRLDIAGWWPKLRAGGILAGHDWGHEWLEGIRAAVLDHARPLGLPVWLVRCREGAHSWFVEKPRGD